MKFANYKDLVNLAEKEGFTVTSTNGDSHNRGSKHYLGLAIDVRTRDKQPGRCDAFIVKCRALGLTVFDERVRPKGQKIWSGPHLHIEIKSDKTIRPVIVKPGSKGVNVKDLQNKLVKAKFLKPDQVDGKFGPATLSAVKLFQSANGLKIDGIVGQQTRLKLDLI